mmetsp:Transcript_22168/g.71692  ORF Transcript_22168/g.71692 Transcript_22168/m.71692 type:complete len:374 (+) Transcript_22168:3275-4396(+)
MLELVELRRSHRRLVHKGVPIHDLGARRCGQRAVVGPVLRHADVRGEQSEVQAQQAALQAPVAHAAARRRQLILKQAQESVLGGAQLVEDANDAKSAGAVLGVDAVDGQGCLHSADGVLRPVVEVALHQGVIGPSHARLRVRGSVQSQLHRVPVVRERGVLRAPSRDDFGPRRGNPAGGQVDRALEVATRAGFRGLATDLSRPHARTVRVPHALLAAPHVAVVHRLWRAVVAPGPRPAHGRRHRVQLGLRHNRSIHEGVPIDGLCARRRGEGALVGPIVPQVEVTDDLVEVYGAAEAGDRRAAREPSARGGQELLDRGDKLVVVSADLVEDTQHTVLAGKPVLRVHAVDSHRHLLAADGVLGAPVPMALSQRV